jgi:predicted DNA-binding transcriptional regulator AlpA
MTDDDPLHDGKTVAARFNITLGVLYNWRWQGRGPKYVKIGRACYYRESAIREWLKAQEKIPVPKKARDAGRAAARVA